MLFTSLLAEAAYQALPDVSALKWSDLNAIKRENGFLELRDQLGAILIEEGDAAAADEMVRLVPN